MKITNFKIENDNPELTLETGEKLPMGAYRQYMGYKEITVISYDGHHPKIDYYEELPGRPAPGTLVIDCRDGVGSDGLGGPHIAE